MSLLVPLWSTFAIVCLYVVASSAWIRRSDDCLTKLQQCAMKVMALSDVLDGGYTKIVTDGQLSFTCDPRAREDARTCVAGIRGCDGANSVDSAVVVWDYACENEQAFTNGAACLSSPEQNATRKRCDETLYQNFDFCDVSRCLKEDIPKIHSCSQTEGDLIYDLSNRMIAAYAGSTC